MITSLVARPDMGTNAYEVRRHTSALDAEGYRIGTIYEDRYGQWYAQPDGIGLATRYEDSQLALQAVVKIALGSRRPSIAGVSV